jgi:hypothetical protein
VIVPVGIGTPEAVARYAVSKAALSTRWPIEFVARRWLKKQNMHQSR